MTGLIDYFYHSRFLGGVFHTLIYCLKRELGDCRSVLDLGCGPSSPLQYCKNVKYSVGVEAFNPYLKESVNKKIHNEYIEKKIEEIDFPEKSFDAVIMIEVLEHLTKQAGYKILKKAEKWARKKVVISTPNGFFPMRKVDGNDGQRHLSGWKVNELIRKGYDCNGLAGFKVFYCQENQVESLSKGSENTFLNMRFKPRKIMYIITAFGQILAYHFPRYSFEIFAVKKK